MTTFEIFKEADKFLEKKELKKAAEVYIKFLSSAHDELTQFTANRNLGFIYYELGELDLAQNYLTSSLNFSFEDENGRINRILGFIFSINKQFDIASEYLEQSISLQEDKNEEYYICLYELGKLMFELAEHNIAIKHFLEAEKFFKDLKSPYYASCLYYLGLIRFVMKEIEVSRSYFEQITTLSNIPTSLKINGYYGLLFVENTEKNGDRIIYLAGKILEIDPKFYDKETLIFFTLKAYQYQNRRLEYEHMLALFISDYPDGKYCDQHNELGDYKFELLNK